MGAASQPSDRPRRSYDSPLRRQQAADTRERIIAAGAALLHDVPIWNWGALTARAVAERAGVNERTVYRHFPTERELRDAVLARLEGDAGVELDGMTLEGVGDVMARIFEFVSSFPIEPRTQRDPTVAAANARQRQALSDAIRPHAKKWPPADRAMAAGVMDVLWSVVSYERLVVDWELEPAQAINALTWAMGVVVGAIIEGEKPSGNRGGPRSV